jgi:hypothetical protein
MIQVYRDGKPWFELRTYSEYLFALFCFMDACGTLKAISSLLVGRPVTQNSVATDIIVTAALLIALVLMRRRNRRRASP